jgi:vacuolar-type H+-ATPase subunit I/STV1
LFAATMMAVIGFFHVVQGLAALFQNQIYVTSTRYIFSFDLTTWGWVHLLVGVLLLVTGFAVTTGRVWARSVGIGFAVLSMITNFAFVPYYPVWSLLIIVIDVFVIWALCVFPRQDART